MYHGGIVLIICECHALEFTHTVYCIPAGMTAVFFLKKKPVCFSIIIAEMNGIIYQIQGLPELKPIW
jgi:hypothetical protein